jgi:poly(3-hydroxybutyrate) depolymerase
MRQLITRQIMRDYSVDPKRVYACGLSAGGASAAIMGAPHADLYAAVGVHSGLACGASDLPSALVAMRQGGGYEATGEARSQLPTIVFHGDRDTTVHQRMATELSSSPPKRRVRRRWGTSRSGTPRACLYRTVITDAGGRAISEHWNIHGAGYAWSGGSPTGSYTDPQGPDASREMLRFFLEHSLPS